MLSLYTQEHNFSDHDEQGDGNGEPPLQNQQVNVSIIKIKIFRGYTIYDV